MGKTSIKAVIFDMDGVISDSQPIHAGLEEALLAEHGIFMSAQELTKKFAGVPDKECARIIFAQHKKEVDLDKFVERKWASILDFAKGKITPIDGAVNLIGQLKDRGFRLAVASSSIQEFIDLVLQELKIKDKFDVLTNGKEVKLGKPNPDIFLLAAKKLGVRPEECWVIEDAEHGMVAAKRAGMKCVWLTNLTQPTQKEYSPDIIVKSLKDLKIESLNA